MKYLEDSTLSKLAAELSDAAEGRSRSIHVRIDTYTMKRAGSDKKYAHALGEKYVAEMETRESRGPVYQFKKEQKDFSSSFSSSSAAFSSHVGKSRRKRSYSVGNQTEIPRPSKQPRSRAYSFDASAPVSVSQQDSALGSFSGRLMTDLILTLNASFPDYDFGAVRPAEFEKVSLTHAVKKINERFSMIQASTESLLPDLWSRMDHVLALSDCDVYSYVPRAMDDDEDPLSFLTHSLINSKGGGNGESSSDSSLSCTVLWNFNYFFVSKQRKRILFFAGVETMQNEECGLEEGDFSDEIPFVKFHGTDASEVDFDIDPSANIAGGIPISI